MARIDHVLIDASQEQVGVLACSNAVSGHAVQAKIKDQPKAAARTKINELRNGRLQRAGKDPRVGLIKIARKKQILVSSGRENRCQADGAKSHVTDALKVSRPVVTARDKKRVNVVNVPLTTLPGHHDLHGIRMLAEELFPHPVNSTTFRLFQVKHKSGELDGKALFAFRQRSCI